MVFLYLLIFVGVMFVILFTLAYLVTRMRNREAKDPEFHQKMQKFRKYSGPISKFTDNLFWWIVCIAFVYFIIMSGGLYGD